MDSYLTSSAADAIAATMIPAHVAIYVAASTPAKTAALLQASIDIDAAGPWQGRKVAADQALQFPRVPYPAGQTSCAGGGQGYAADTYYPPPTWGEVVWDWDTDGLTAVPPDQVLRAVVYQAAWLLSPASAKSEERRQVIGDGLSAQNTGGMSESYRDPLTVGAAGSIAQAVAMLTPRANQLLVRYRLKSGRIL